MIHLHYRYSGTEMKRHRVLLADHHPMIVEGMRGVLSPFYELVGVAMDGRTLVESALRLRPDLIVLGVALPLLNGIDAAAQIRESLCEAKLLFFTEHSAYLQVALATGADGYLLKSASGTEILHAIETILNGRSFVSPSLRDSHTERSLHECHAVDNAHLSARECEILRLIAAGQAAKEIAYSLAISARTVSFHRDNIKKKLGIRSTAGLTRYTIERGLSTAA